LFLITSTPVFAGNVNLAWDPNTELIQGYKIYYGTASRTYGSTIVVGNTTNYSVTGLVAGTYYFAVTSYDALGNESGFSNETSTTLTCTSSLSTTSQSFSQATGTGSVVVTTSTGCNWTAASNASWITISSGSNGSGNGTVNFLVAANTAAAPRTGTLTIAGQIFTVTQAGSSCTFSISPTSQDVSVNGGSDSVTVTTATGCDWTVLSNASWLTITSGATGSGPANSNYTVAANTSGGSRSGTITIAGQTFTVTQAGTSCTYSVLPTAQSFGRKGGTGSVAVTTSMGCSWTAASNASWITVTSASSGSGSGTVNYKVAATPKSRSGTLTIAGQTVVVTQNSKKIIYFSQFASGAGWDSSLVLINPSSSETATGSATFLNQQGEPTGVSLNSQASGSVALFTIPPLGSFTWTTNGAGDLVSGSVRISAEIPVSGVVKYSHPEFGVAGLGESLPLRSVMTSVVRDASRGSNTGIALSNPQSTEAELALSLRDVAGGEVRGGSASLRIPPNGSVAKFINELFPKAETAKFQGTLVISSSTPDGSVCATALHIGSSTREFNSMPVVAVDPAPTTTQLFFAQFVNGANWTSSLDLINPFTSANSGLVSVFGGDGKRWAASVNGQALSENVSFNTQPQSNLVVRTDGQGNLAAGSVTVTASSAIGGVLTFTFPDLGIATVGPSIPMTGFIAPMMRSSSRQLSTGVAVASTGSAVRINLKLRNQRGELLPGGEAELDLPPNGHLSRFIEQLFPSADTREFEGTLIVTAEGGDIIGTAIQVGKKKGELTALPVTPLR
jgi:hypothetical protein